MESAQQTLVTIQNTVQQIVPDAKVLLFGSRAHNTATEESDWDILIITKHTLDKRTKRLIQDALFPLSVQLASFINIIMVNEREWNTNPSYYPLKQSITTKNIVT